MASQQLSEDSSNMTASVMTLTKIRNASSNNRGGIVIINQFFKFPQVGEIIRDILLLQNFVDMHLTTDEKTEENNNPESENKRNALEQIKQCDPTLIDSLRLVKTMN